MTTEFAPAWWLRGPNLQTLWGKFFRRRTHLETRIERLSTPDGDFLEEYVETGDKCKDVDDMIEYLLSKDLANPLEYALRLLAEEGIEVDGLLD